MNKNFIDFLNGAGIAFEENKPASEFTSFRIGGSCFAVYPKNAGELINTVNQLKSENIRYAVIGAGSNVLFSDNGYNGVVLLTKYIDEDTVIDGCVIKASCGTILYNVCKTACENSLSGAEFAYGIPGSVGGAVFMNAGAYGGEIKDICTSVTAYSPTENVIKFYTNDECEFGYRRSRFSDGSDEIILSAEFTLSYGEKEKIAELMKDVLQRRKDKQPLNYPSAGSVFKRYPGRYTGQMIEAAGLKGYTVGGAQVSEKHAGFIVNIGGAKAEDVRELVTYIKSVIREREGVELECELRFID
jgi:UDP-N-acetylmuramate dehydrogenase